MRFLFCFFHYSCFLFLLFSFATVPCLTSSFLKKTKSKNLMHFINFTMKLLKFNACVRYFLKTQDTSSLTTYMKCHYNQSLPYKHSQKTKTLCHHVSHFLSIYCLRLTVASKNTRDKLAT